MLACFVKLVWPWLVVIATFTNPRVCLLMWVGIRAVALFGKGCAKSFMRAVLSVLICIACFMNGARCAV